MLHPPRGDGQISLSAMAEVIDAAGFRDHGIQYLARVRVVEALTVDEEDGSAVRGRELGERLRQILPARDSVREVGPRVETIGQRVERHDGHSPDAVELVDAGVVGDPVEPRTERRLA